MKEAFLDILACPKDHGSLTLEGDSLVCSEGHRFPVVEGIPVMLIPEEVPTHAEVFQQTLSKVEQGNYRVEPDLREGEIDPLVREEVHGTCGLFYTHSGSSLLEYPIPEMVVPDGEGLLLDVGCGWGRWLVAAGRKGFRPVGVDPNIDYVLAAQRVTRQMGIEADLVVADARHLPFKKEVFDVVHSYAVFLHFAKEDTISSLESISRVMKRGAQSYIQLPNRTGLRNLSVQVSNGFKESENRSDFSTRYWSLNEMSVLFKKHIGENSTIVEGYGYTSAGGIPKSAFGSLPLFARLALKASDLMRRASRYVPPLRFIADSVYIHANKARS